MAELKLNDAFAAEVDAFRAAGEVLSDVTSPSTCDTEGLSLSVVKEYILRLDDIWRLLFDFYLLTKKDATDMDALADSIRAADNSSGGVR